VAHSATAAISALWHAITSTAKKYANRAQLRNGANYQVAVRVVGTVGGYAVDEPIEGRLTVGYPTEAPKASAVKYDELAAKLLQAIPSTQRQAVKDEITEARANKRPFEGIDKADIKDAKLWLQQLRTTELTEKDGAVSFELNPAIEDA